MKQGAWSCFISISSTMLSLQWVLKKNVFSESMKRGSSKGQSIAPSVTPVTQLPRAESVAGSGDASFPIQEFAGPSTKLDFLFSGPLHP